MLEHDIIRPPGLYLIRRRNANSSASSKQLTAAADAAACRSAELADLILIPCRPSAFDLKAIRTTLDLVEAAKKPAFVVLNAAPVRSRAADAARAVVIGLKAEVAPVVISQRAAFGHSCRHALDADGPTRSRCGPNKTA